MELRWVEELVEVDPRIRSTLFETSTYEFLLDVQRCSFARHIEIVALQDWKLSERALITTLLKKKTTLLIQNDGIKCRYNIKIGQ